ILPLSAAFAMLVATAVSASVVGKSGPYTVEIKTEPAVIPVNKAQLILKITDSAGKPVEGAEVKTLAQMPGMPMGEKEAPAAPKPGEPGMYSAPAVFMMAGGYDAMIQLHGPQGDATVR